MIQEEAQDTRPPTRKQEQLITKPMKAFPDGKELESEGYTPEESEDRLYAAYLP